MSSLFRKNIKDLKGVGENRAKLFAKLGIKSVGTLLQFYPRSYRDFSDYIPMENVLPDTICCVKAKVITDVSVIRARNNMIISKFDISDETACFKVVFFNNKYISDSIKNGEEYFFIGKIIKNSFQKELISPIFRKVVPGLKIEPIYMQTKNLSSNVIKNCVKKALELLPENMGDTIPDNIREKYDLCTLNFALQNIHFPANKEALESAKYRISFENLLIFYLAMTQFKDKNKTMNGNFIKKSFKSDFLNLLPFELTYSQNKVLDECLDEMQNGKYSMSRLIQGDVGCGKTVIAAGLVFCTVKNHMQAAIMAPTEILAVQHFNYFMRLFQDCNMKIKLLTSSAKLKEKKEILLALENEQVDILIGTHAILSENVNFLKLGIVVTDEQHRFGVKQREKLCRKGENPHVVIMSATPIPRTLALILFREYDISVIDEIPKGRLKVKTYLIDSEKRLRVFTFIKRLIDDGYQGYIVCPVIEENIESNLNSIESYDKIIKGSCLSECRYALLHGKMKERNKQKIMADFFNGKIDIIISTTVIEVGVDVPNACVILIENAERFGFSQLHQLRGRVGRSNIQSYCILLSDTNNKLSMERLETLCHVNDGFKIAAKDLKMRGPGDFFGIRQHGEVNREILSGLNDTHVFEKIIQASSDILNDDCDLYSPQYKLLKGQINLKVKNRKLF